MERIVSPLVAQLAAQTTQLGDLREELGRTQEQRDQARRELADLRAQPAHVEAVPPSSPEPQDRPIVLPLRPRSALGYLITALAKRLG